MYKTRDEHSEATTITDIEHPYSTLLTQSVYYSHYLYTAYNHQFESLLIKNTAKPMTLRTSGDALKPNNIPKQLL